MRKLSITSRSLDCGETSGEIGNFTNSFTGKDFYQNLIDRANTVPLLYLFKHYSISLDEHRKKIICPFPSHKNGHENSASFYFYPHTNSFWCFGCKTGRYGCNFVAAMDRTNKIKAAYKILEIFGSEADDDNIYDEKKFSDKMEIMMDFATCIRNFHSMYNDEKSYAFIEHVCMIYDKMNLRHELDNTALRDFVQNLKDTVNSYKL